MPQSFWYINKTSVIWKPIFKQLSEEFYGILLNNPFPRPVLEPGSRILPLLLNSIT